MKAKPECYCEGILSVRLVCDHFTQLFSLASYFVITPNSFDCFHVYLYHASQKLCFSFYAVETWQLMFLLLVATYMYVRDIVLIISR